MSSVFIAFCMDAFLIHAVFQLKVGPVDGIRRDYAPGKSFSFQVKGDPGAKVSLVAVDNAVYLLNRDRLTQRKVCVCVNVENPQIFFLFFLTNTT